MALNKGKHIIAELDGVRCTVVESKIGRERKEFLRELLVNNGYEVKVQQEAATDPDTEPLFTIGVTDLVFNPVIAVYQKKLRRPDGSRVTPSYWNQWDEPQQIPYWLVGRP